MSEDYRIVERSQRRDSRFLQARMPTDEEVESVSRTLTHFYERIIHICTITMHVMWVLALLLILTIFFKRWWLVGIGVVILGASLLVAGEIRAFSMKSKEFRDGKFRVCDGYVDEVIPIEQDVIGEVGVSFASTSGSRTGVIFRVLKDNVYKNTRLILVLPNNKSIKTRAFTPFMLTEDGAMAQIPWRTRYYAKKQKK